MPRETRIKVFSTGTLTGNSDSHASFSASTNPVNGVVQAIKYTVNPSATFKIYLADISGANYSIQLAVSGTDVVLPRAPTVNESGAAVANEYVSYPFLGYINVDVDTLADGSTAQLDVWYK